MMLSLQNILINSALAQYQLETKLPQVSGAGGPGGGLPQYINYIFVFGLGLITILALGTMMFGGIQYILAAGNASKVEEAKKWIYGALYGLGIMLISYLLLRTINPDLVRLRNPDLTPQEFKIESQTQAPAGGPFALPTYKCGDTECLTTEYCVNDSYCQTGAFISP